VAHGAHGGQREVCNCTPGGHQAALHLLSSLIRRVRCG